MEAHNLKPYYPDVLGAITKGPRINMDVLEAVVGIHPKMAYLNQPIEVVIVLQNMVNQPLQLKAAIRLPTTDPKGHPVVMDTAKSMVSLKLPAGEVGVLRLPIVARPPTRPGKGYPVRVAIRYRVADYEPVRPPGGGSPPTVLSVSPFKLQVLREVPFAAQKWNESNDILTVAFDLVAQNFPGNPPDMRLHYETLWSQEEFQQEVTLIRKYVADAVEIATPGPTGLLYLSLLEEVTERFAAREMPLHPGEAMAIAKMMAYTVEDAPQREPDVNMEDMRWFRSLCQVLAHDPSLMEEERAEVISQHVFEGILYEAILIGFKIISQHVDEDLGNRVEQINYANRVIKWLAGSGDGDLSFIYLPLVLGGVTIGRIVRGAYGENAWDLYDQLQEAYRGRLRLVAHDETAVIFQMLEEFLESYARKLRASRIDRPENR